MAMTGAVKDELSRLNVTQASCRRAEVAAMLRFAGGLHIVAGRVVLDSVRAIDNYDEALKTPRPPGTLPLTTRPLGISDSPMVMSGFSGGAIAAHGAVKQLDDYAPELKGRIRATALGGDRKSVV